MTRPVIAASCVAATTLGIDNLHRNCRGNGPLFIEGVHAPVLPAEQCECSCHTATAAAPISTVAADRRGHPPVA